MGSLERFKIDLQGLKGEAQAFEFGLSNDFFEDLDIAEVRGGRFKAQVEVRKVVNDYQLRFHVEGQAVVACDLCLDDMSIPVDTDYQVVAKLGDNFLEDEGMVTIPADNPTIDTAWLIYECIALALPTRHVHEPGGCNPEMEQRMRQLSVEADDAPAADPRWSELEKLKSTIKE